MTEQTTALPSEPRPPAVEPAAPTVRRTLGLPVVGAIAAATLVIGGLLGGIIGYAVHSDGPDLDGRQGGPGQRFQQGGGQQGGGQQGGPGNGQLPQPPSNG
jgi:hypothetical protein